MQPNVSCTRETYKRENGSEGTSFLIILANQIIRWTHLSKAPNSWIDCNSVRLPDLSFILLLLNSIKVFQEPGDLHLDSLVENPWDWKPVVLLQFPDDKLMTACNLIQRFGLGNNQRFPTLHNPSPSTNIYICKRDLKSLTSKQNSLKTVQSNFSHRIIIHLPKDLSTVFGAWFLDMEIHSFNAKS